MLSAAHAMPQDAWPYDYQPYDSRFYGRTPDYGILREDYAPARPLLRRQPHRKHRHRTAIKPATPLRKPQGPLIVTISINKQSLKVFDANGPFAETRVSTGMRGHATPMGIFSVIQKNKWHRSNIYSGASMPYMQRLTWSGIALHAGVVPGYPASHGCIRMPSGFAAQIWKWTRMGARVVIAPNEIAPAPIAHALLATRKPTAPTPVAAAEPASPGASGPGPASTIGKAADAKSAAVVPVAAELRLSIISEKAAPHAIATSDKPEKPTLVADAGNAASQLPGQTLADAPVSVGVTPPASKPAPPVHRSGPIAVFISGKDSRLYVRQNFAPLFDVAITIAPSDRPLGTHVFTAAQDKQSGAFRWSVISMPARTNVRASRTRRARHDAAAAPSPAPDSASEALDRLTIPPETMTRIAQALTTASSVIVSDQGVNSGETGKGTDFIVPLR